MRRLLLLSFDHFRPGEPHGSYPLACLSAAVLGDPDLWPEWAVDVVSIDLNRERPWSRRGVARLVKEKARQERYDVIAFGDYCWSTRYVPDLFALFGEWQPGAHVIAGGYQVTSTRSDDLGRHYPTEGHPVTFVKGFAETAVVSALRRISAGDAPPALLEEPIDCRALRSPWLAGELAVASGDTVRWETKRGCRYACDYCEFKAARNRPKDPVGMVLARDRLLEELELFRAAGVKKVNLLDPLFNIDGTYEHLLEPMLRSGLSFTLQTRVEDLARQPVLLDAAKQNARLHLEIGVQTLDDELNQLLCRNNQKDVILSTLSRLRAEGVSFETNLIFGIPGQTPASHLADVESLMAAGCEKDAIRCFPLRIPRGSRLEKKKAELHVEEAPYGGGDTLVVTADGFDRLDWLRMLLVSEADASYVARARELLASPDTEARLSARNWLVDGAVWGDALGRNDYLFRVMEVCADGTLRAHGEYEALEFVRGGGRPVRLAPGLFYAMGWVGSVARRDAPREEFFRYVILERSRWGVSWRRPARVVRHQIDVSGRVVELWVTWKLDWREGLRLARSLGRGGPPRTLS